MRSRFVTMLLLLPMTAGLGISAGTPAHAIADGQDVPTGRYSFAVKLTMTGIPAADGGARNSSCSGALIAPRWVITAGHCFRTPKGTRVSRLVARLTTATAGRTDLTGKAGHKVKVIAVRQSPDTDVALAELAEPITDITPAVLSRKPPKVGAIVRLAGYGLTVDNRESSLATRLQTGQFEVVSRSRAFLGMTGHAPSSTTSACKRDSGGPYFTQRGDGPAVLVSVVSRGPSCPHSGVDLSGRIDPIYPWITGIVGRPAPTATTEAPDSAPARPSASPSARDRRLAEPPAPKADNTPMVAATGVAAIVILGFGGVLTLVFGGRSRRRSQRRSGVRRHRRR